MFATECACTDLCAQEMRCSPASQPVWVLSAPLAELSFENSQQWSLHHSEQERLASISRPSREKEYLAGRLLIRQALRAVIELNEGQAIEPHGLIVPQHTYGAQPFVAASGVEWFVSLSHSDGQLAAAISTSAVGLDIESTGKLRDFGALRDACGMPSVPAGMNEGSHFYREWTLKEAAIKLRGAPLGLAMMRAIETEEIKEPFVTDCGPKGNGLAVWLSSKDVGRFALAVVVGLSQSIDLRKVNASKNEQTWGSVQYFRVQVREKNSGNTNTPLGK